MGKLEKHDLPMGKNRGDDCASRARRFLGYRNDHNCHIASACSYLRQHVHGQPIIHLSVHVQSSKYTLTFTAVAHVKQEKVVPDPNFIHGTWANDYPQPSNPLALAARLRLIHTVGCTICPSCFLRHCCWFRHVSNEPETIESTVGGQKNHFHRSQPHPESFGGTGNASPNTGPGKSSAPRGSRQYQFLQECRALGKSTHP